MRMSTNTIVRDQVDVAFYPCSLEFAANQRRHAIGDHVYFYRHERSQKTDFGVNDAKAVADGNENSNPDDFTVTARL